jgi:hypothetical protein
MATRSITLPAELQEKLMLERRDINVSGVCTAALWEAVGEEPAFSYRQRQVVKELESEVKKLRGLLKQVRGQRDAAQRKLDKYIVAVRAGWQVKLVDDTWVGS